MKTSTIVWTGIVLVVLAGGWYWWSGMQQLGAPSAQTAQPQTETQATLPTAAESAANVPVLALGTDPKLGGYIITPSGMTLYIYSKDAKDVSNCSGACAANWPPYTVAAGTALPTSAGIGGVIATITRADGTTQVTYKGMPLYLWVRDVKAGDVTGNNVGGFLLAKP